MPFHIRRSDRAIKDPNVLIEIIKRNRIASLALCRNNEPYVVTLTYGYNEIENAFYFHCGNEGLKLDIIRSNPNVCLTVIEVNGIESKTCNHPYRSIVARGKIEIIRKKEETDKAIKQMIDQLEEKEIENAYSRLNENNKFYNELTILKVKVEELTGKEKIKKA